MGKKEQHYSKNVTLSIDAIEVINGYCNRTKQNFSKTLDIIVKEWDNVSVQLERIKRDKEIKENLTYLDQLKNTKAVK
jgi:hypothetical protein